MGWLGRGQMARITQRLTAIEVTNLKEKGLYPDGDGLYLKVTGAGTKSWIYRAPTSRILCLRRH